MNANLLETTVQLLRDCDLSFQKISADTGLKMRWLYRLLDGDFHDPGVRKIETLHRYLTETIKSRSPNDST